MAEVGKKTEKKTQVGRDVYKTPEGEMVSEKSTTFKYKGKWINVPSIYKGHKYDDDTLILMLEAGLIKPTSTHNSQKEAEKAARERSENLKFNKGGTPMMEQQARLFRRGGLNDEGGQIDKESGNEVPVGGTKKGVRDDIPINISEGEFIFPEDVTRYIGLKELMNMRQEAKMGLKKMEAMGLMGNADEATIPDDLPFSMEDLIVVQVADKEDSEEDRADMKTGGLGSRSRLLSTPQVRPEPITVEEGEKVVTDIMEAVEYRNAAGNSIIIMHYGGSPMYPIPAGYSRYDPETGELGEIVNPAPVTTTANSVNKIIQGVSEASKKDKPESLEPNEFTKAGSWDNSPMDIYIKEAKKFSDGSSSIATSVMGIMGPSGFGLLTYGLVKLEKRKILNTIDDRIKNATGEQKQELIRIRDTLLGKIKGPNFVEKITNFVDGILAPEEVKAEVKNTAVKDVNQPATVNNPEEVLPDELTIPPFDSAAKKVLPYGLTKTDLDAFGGQDVFDISQQAPITNLLGPIEEVAARDVPVETGQTYDQELFNNLKNTISLGKIDDPRLPPEYRGGEGSEGYNRIISEAEKFYGKNIVQDVLNSLTPVVPAATRGVQDRGFVPANIAQPAATAESIAPTLTTTTPTETDMDVAFSSVPVQQPKVSPRLGYESGQDVLQSVAPYISSTIGQPSGSQIDYSNIQTSGPPSVPDALRTPLGTAAAESALKQEATLPQSYDSSVDDLVEQTREAFGTSDQSIEETIAKAQEVINKPRVTEDTTSESTFKPSASPILNAAKSIAELGSTFVPSIQDQTEQAFSVQTEPVSPYDYTPVTPTPTVTTADYAPPSVSTPATFTPTVTTADYAPPSVSALGLGDPDIDFTTPTVSPKVEIDFDPSQTLGDPAISGMVPSTLTATPIVSSVSPTETGLSSFEQAFADARAAGQDIFSFEGETYTTKLASDTKPAVKAASDDKYGGATVTGDKFTEALGGLKAGETKLKSEVEADNLANAIGVSREEYDTMSEYEKSQALAGSDAADRREQAIREQELQTLATEPRPPSGLSREAAKRWLQENGYGNVDIKEAVDYIKNLQEDWDRENKK
jgi:hypothetical protein